MHKAIKNPDFESESVLSNDPWLFVELWLKRQKKSDALAYWLQARRFAEASALLGVEAAPLTLYYAFLNATKALLLVRGSTHGNTHGVSGERPEKAKASLANEIVTFQSGGVLPGLSGYLGESTISQRFTLKDLFWNIPFIHRAFRHTFTSKSELFVPIENATYVKSHTTSESWFQAEIVPRYTDGRILRHLPSSFEYFTEENKTYVRRKKRFRWISGKANKQTKAQAISRLTNYHSSTRRVIVPISGNRDLWYLKKSFADNPPAERHQLSVMFAAMHRLSELARYDPNGLDRHLCGSANWLISEFIEHSSGQFIDQIATEITGYQFWKPQIRS